MEFLSSSHMLRHLQPTILKSLGQAMEGVSFDHSKTIYNPGDPASHFYVVVSGEVGIWEEVSSPGAAATTDLHGTAGGTGGLLGETAEGGVSSTRGVGWAVRTAGAGVSQQRQGSAAGGRAASSSSSGSAGRSEAAARVRSGASGDLRGASRGGGSSAEGSAPAAAAPPQPPAPVLVEVRRLGPRESFGRDDVMEGSTRNEKAMAVASGCGSAGGAPAAGGWGRSMTKGRSKAGGSTTAAGAGGPASSSPAAAAAEQQQQQQQQQQQPVVLLALAADEYAKVLAGRMSRMQEDKVDFLESLPALQGLTRSYLQSLAHCFHQTVRGGGECADLGLVGFARSTCSPQKTNMHAPAERACPPPPHTPPNTTHYSGV